MGVVCVGEMVGDIVGGGVDGSSVGDVDGVEVVGDDVGGDGGRL